MINDDCIKAMMLMDQNSIDSMVTDPPAGIAFMGKDWDKDKGGRDGWIEWMTTVMIQAHRVLKPGAHAFVWAIPRTSHWTATALENAGFEIRDIVTHVFGSGFPKSHNISKGIDKKAGATREVTGRYEFPDGGNRVKPRTRSERVGQLHGHKHTPITAPSTDQAKQWDGWGTALKPASEHWILVRKPFKGTVVNNVLTHGTGGINIDASRIGTSDNLDRPTVDTSSWHGNNWSGSKQKTIKGSTNYGHSQGRFPANFILSHSEDCEPSPYVAPNGDCISQCADFCPIRLLDEQSGSLHPPGRKASSKQHDGGSFGGGLHGENDSYNDKGGASRFFYCAKSSKRERNEGLEGFESKKQPTMSGGNGIGGKGPHDVDAKQNHHPTVKAQKLMKYLITMITPPGGIVLDPFMGSGSTGVAAKSLGYEFVGIEKEEEYFQIANARITSTELDPT